MSQASRRRAALAPPLAAAIRAMRRRNLEAIAYE
jgi:hypothetical protein